MFLFQITKFVAALGNENKDPETELGQQGKTERADFLIIGAAREGEESSAIIGSSH